MMTPAHCDKSPLKEIILRTKEEGMPISININVWSAVAISGYRNWYILTKHIMYRYTKKDNNFFFLLFPFSQMHKATHFMVLGNI
jgi:hypothetical protein